MYRQPPTYLLFNMINCSFIFNEPSPASFLFISYLSKILRIKTGLLISTGFKLGSTEYQLTTCPSPGESMRSKIQSLFGIGSCWNNIDFNFAQVAARTQVDGLLGQPRQSIQHDQLLNYAKYTQELKQAVVNNIKYFCQNKMQQLTALLTKVFVHGMSQVCRSLRLCLTSIQSFKVRNWLCNLKYHQQTGCVTT